MTVDRRAAVLTAMICAGFVLVVALVISVANVVPDTADIVASRPYIHLNIFLAVSLALVFGTVVVTFVYIGIADQRAGRKISTLYLPLIAEPIGLFIIFGLSAIAGLDREHHNLKTPLTGRWNLTPAVQILQVGIIYTALVWAYGWLVGIVLTGRGWSRRQVLLLYAALAVLAAVLVTWAAMT